MNSVVKKQTFIFIYLFFFVNININGVSTCCLNIYNFVVTFVVTGGRSWSFQTLNLNFF